MPSNKVLEAKKGLVEEIKAKLDGAQAGVLVDYRGITVEEDTALRKAMREAGVDYSVVKNTLLNFAIKGTDIESISAYLEGPSAIAISKTDPVAPAKIIGQFIDKHEKLTIKTGFMDGKVVDVAEIVKISKLPSREEMLAKAFGSMKAPISNLARVINQIKEKKESENA